MYHPRFHSLEGFPLTVSFQGPIWVGNSDIATTCMSVHLYNNPAHPWAKIKCFATLACHQGPSMHYKCELKGRCDETGMYAGLCSTRVLPVWLMLNPRCATSILPYTTWLHHIQSPSAHDGEFWLHDPLMSHGQAFGFHKGLVACQTFFLKVHNSLLEML